VQVSTINRSRPRLCAVYSYQPFKSFCSAVIYFIVPLGDIDKEPDIPWGMFLSCFAFFYNNYDQIIRTFLLLLNESMSGWQPKDAKLGGIPNCT
jgi:hypothetical protein